MVQPEDIMIITDGTIIAPRRRTSPAPAAPGVRLMPSPEGRRIVDAAPLSASPRETNGENGQNGQRN